MKVLLWSTSLIPFILGSFFSLPQNTGQTLFYRAILSLLSLIFVFALVTRPAFTDSVIARIKSIYKNPIVLSVLALITLSIISTIFAVNKYNALWGTIERVEGLVGLIFIFAFFIYSILIFNRKDWVIFFKINLLASLIVGSRELLQFMDGVSRPGSFLGNSTVLAGYLLFSILCAFIVFSEAKNKLWKYISVLVFLLSILGIFLTETRGTLFGFFLGFILILVYGIARGKEVSIFQFNFKKVSVIVLSVLIAFSILFIFTRSSVIWKGVPGLGRIAQISGEDTTTRTRIMAAKAGLQAVDPSTNGIKKFIIGWGLENYSLAYGKYFDVDQYNYEMKWFDRSHNKLIDVLVMTGLLGLLAYLCVYFFFFRSIFQRKEVSLLNIGLLFFGMSLLGHLLFFFDHLTISLALFAVLGFTVYLAMPVDNEQNNSKKEKFEINVYYLELLFLVISIFLIYVFIRGDVLGYTQTKRYNVLLGTGNSVYISENISSVFNPITISQSNIRQNFLLIMEKYYDPKDPQTVLLSELSVVEAESYLEKNPSDLLFLMSTAYSLSNQGKATDNMELLIKGEEYYRKLLVYAPDFPNAIYYLGLNLFYQERYEESLFYLEKVFNLTESFFKQRAGESEEFYLFFSKYFSKNKKDPNFITVNERLERINSLK